MRRKKGEKKETVEKKEICAIVLSQFVIKFYNKKNTQNSYTNKRNI